MFRQCCYAHIADSLDARVASGTTRTWMTSRSSRRTRRELKRKLCRANLCHINHQSSRTRAQIGKKRQGSLLNADQETDHLIYQTSLTIVQDVPRIPSRSGRGFAGRLTPRNLSLDRKHSRSAAQDRKTGKRQRLPSRRQRGRKHRIKPSRIKASPQCRRRRHQLSPSPKEWIHSSPHRQAQQLHWDLRGRHRVHRRRRVHRHL